MKTFSANQQFFPVAEEKGVAALINEKILFLLGRIHKTGSILNKDAIYSFSRRQWQQL
ncbi:MAG TPA: hypothetical protein VK563_00120 [Puia sp.]|nr:hypothetical protein [Puia sp.]